MASTPYEAPAEHRQFLTEFQALLDRHPGAADRFILADIGAGAVRLRSAKARLPELDCVATEWGLVCKFEPVL